MIEKNRRTNEHDRDQNAAWNLILQGLTAQALMKAGYTYAENHMYDEISEVPDFLASRMGMIPK